MDAADVVFQLLCSHVRGKVAAEVPAVLLVEIVQLHPVDVGGVSIMVDVDFHSTQFY